MSEESIEEVTQMLSDLAKVASFFMINPEYQKAVDALKQDIVKHQKLCGVYKTVKVAQKFKTDSEELMEAAEGQYRKAAAQVVVAENERNNIHKQIKSTVAHEVSELRSELEQTKANYEGAIETQKVAQEEIDSLLSEARDDHDKREASLNKREQQIVGKEASLAGVEKGLNETKAKIAAAKEKMADLANI